MSDNMPSMEDQQEMAKSMLGMNHLESVPISERSQICMRMHKELEAALANKQWDVALQVAKNLLSLILVWKEQVYLETLTMMYKADAHDGRGEHEQAARMRAIANHRPVDLAARAAVEKEM